MSYPHGIQQLMGMVVHNPLELLHLPQNMHLMQMPGPPQHQNIDEESEEEDDEDSRTLFCANLDERVTEELLYEIFLQAGPIEKARIPKDNNGRQRTFGFVTYVHRCTPPYAMHLYQGLTLFRKSLTIKFQGATNSNQSPMRHAQSSGYNHSRYDNSSLRGGNYSANNDSLQQNPFKSPQDSPSGSSGNRHDNISKHSNHSRLTNSSPYNRRGGSGASEESHRDRNYNRDKKRNHHSGSNRNSNQRNQR